MTTKNIAEFFTISHMKNWMKILQTCVNPKKVNTGYSETFNKKKMWRLVWMEEKLW